MKIVQVIECVKCGNKETAPYGDPANLKTPWEIWPNGCPKCGNSKIDVTVIVDKSDLVKGTAQSTRKIVEAMFNMTDAVVPPRKLQCGCEIGIEGGAFVIKPCSPRCSVYQYVVEESRRQGHPVHFVELKE